MTSRVSCEKQASMSRLSPDLATTCASHRAAQQLSAPSMARWQCMTCNCFPCVMSFPSSCGTAAHKAHVVSASLAGAEVLVSTWAHAMCAREVREPRACCRDSGQRAQTPGQSSPPGMPCAGKGRQPFCGLATRPRRRSQSRPRTGILIPAAHNEQCQMMP